jgi:hypothetical protein
MSPFALLRIVFAPYSFTAQACEHSHQDLYKLTLHTNDVIQKVWYERHLVPSTWQSGEGMKTKSLVLPPMAATKNGQDGHHFPFFFPHKICVVSD